MSTVTALKQAAATITSAMSSLKSGGTAGQMINLLKQLDDGLDDVVRLGGDAQMLGRDAQTHILPAVRFASDAKGYVPLVRVGLSGANPRIPTNPAANLESLSLQVVERIAKVPQPVADAGKGAARITWPVWR